MNCIVCSKLLAGRKTWKDRRYCSRTCHQRHVWNLRKAEFEKTGVWPGCSHEVAVRRFMKRYLLEVRGVRCEICKLTEWMGKEIPLILDHIDGNAENTSPGNTRLVCGNCDMQLPTYKSKNRGKGRAWRRQRYQDGKSS